MLVSTKGRIWSAIGTFCSLLLVWYLWSAAPGRAVNEQQSFAADLNSSNATLGFGAIYVLTADPQSYRLQGLLQAASLAGIRVQPVMPERLTDEELYAQVKKYRTGDEPEAGWAHSRAALGHLVVLEVFAQSAFDTALILEDDADFGINIRPQMQAVSHAAWNRSGESLTAEVERHPYREHEWDILWLGHPGIEYVEGTEVYEYDDAHALPWHRLFSVENRYYERIAEGEYGITRPHLLYNVVPCIGSWAYATTRAHALGMLRRFSAEDSGLRANGKHFDNLLSEDCSSGKVRCVAPAPELFHHQQVLGEKPINEAGNRSSQGLEWYKQHHKYSYNIEWSARCNAAEVGERIGDRWQCLPNKDDPLDS